MPTKEDCFHRQQGHSFEPAKRFWSPSHGFKRKSARTKSTKQRGGKFPRPCGQRKCERCHLLARTIKYNSPTGSGVYRCCLEGTRQRSSSGRRSGFAAKFLANSFKSHSRHTSHPACHTTANSNSIGCMSTCGAIPGHPCARREGYTVR